MTKKHVLLSGPPGIGKTTLIEKLLHRCQQKSLLIDGFFTREVRSPENKRLGFDVVTVSGQSGPLARLDASFRGPRVGQYVVTLDSLEKLTLPLLEKANVLDVLIIDEIGKMELFSHHFTQAVLRAFSSESHTRILSTIPMKGLHSLPLVEELRKRDDVLLIEVSRSNRDVLEEEIMNHLLRKL